MKFRDQFPFFANQPKLIYADSAATSHKPASVINAITQFLSVDYATVHRSGYDLATASTQKYEQTRSTLATLINCDDKRSIVFTKGATEALNLVANGLGRCDWLNGNEILICGSEHHANLLPWQWLAAQCNLTLRVMPITPDGRLDVEAALSMISENTAIVAMAHVSNALGNLYPVKIFSLKAKQNNAVSVIDGTQALPHVDVDVDDLECDFYAFSGHKMFGPTGTGVLYGRYPLLEKLPAYQLGGEMVKRAQYESADFQQPPFKFEAGTPNILGVIGLGEAANFILANKQQVVRQETVLAQILYEELISIDEIELLGDFAKGESKIPIASFTLKGLHVNDLAVLLVQNDIALRHGHHCTMPLMQSLGIDGTLRVSLAAYNTNDEVYRLVETLRRCIKELNHVDKLASNGLVPIIKNSQHLPLAQKIMACHSWDNMFRQIMLAGKTLKALAAEYQCDRYYVGGCEADVWLLAEQMKHQESLVFSAYSTSKIIRGLLAIVLERANSLPSDVQHRFDYQGYLSEIGLVRFLSDSRQNGIGAVIAKIKQS